MTPIATAFARFRTLADTHFPSRGSWAPMLFFRNIGALAIAAVLCSVPEAGPNRFLLAAFLVFFCIPAATWMEWKYPVADHGWSEPLFDLTVLITTIHFVPSVWFPGLVIGLIIVQAPSVAESGSSFFFHAVFAAMLTLGMGFAAVVHDVEGWKLPVLCMVVLYPSVIFYSRRQTLRANEIREEAKALAGLRLVAGGVAHDFNNALMSVVGNAEIARDDLSAEHPARGAIEEVLAGAQRASLLSARLLAFSGRGSEQPEALDIEAELWEIVGLMRAVVPKGVQIELESRLEGERVWADRAKLQQVVMNLISNAGEALQSAPDTVQVTLASLENTTTDERWIEIRVIDRGVGISETDRTQIFDPHFSLKEGGRGLGLAGARPILDEMGGRIEIESRRGEGTEARILLPTISIEVATSVAKPAGPSPSRSEIALVVDDDASVRTAMAAMLRRFGYEVVEAEDACAAIDRLRERGAGVSVVLLDLLMPKTNGWQCFRQLRALQPNVPVILCSGYDPSTDENQRIGRLTRALTKPFASEQLGEALLQLETERRSIRIGASAAAPGSPRPYP